MRSFGRWLKGKSGSPDGLLNQSFPLSPPSIPSVSGLSQGSEGLAPEGRATGKVKFMALYEHVILVRQDVTSQQVDTINEQYKGVIEANGGTITKTEYWGVKTLAFRIKKNRKAHFTLLNIDAPHQAVAEVERLEAISEDVIRSLTIKVEELEEAPSAMLQKRDRDDDRGDRPSGGRGFGGGGGGRFGGGAGGGGFGGGAGRAPRPPRDAALEEESF